VRFEVEFVVESEDAGAAVVVAPVVDSGVGVGVGGRCRLSRYSRKSNMYISPGVT